MLPTIIPPLILKVQHIKILHLEDFEADAVLVERTLKNSGLLFEIKLVDNELDFTNALTAFSPAIVLSDHNLPGFTSVEALRIVKSMSPRIPFILITATISEEFAIDMMKEGVDDYILKDRIMRLPKAIENVLRKMDAENEKQQYFNEVKKAGQKLEALIENISDAILIINRMGYVAYTSPSVKRITGFDFEEMKGKSLSDFLHPRDGQPIIDFFNSISSKRAPMQEQTFRVTHHNGDYIWVEGSIRNVEYEGSERSFIINYRDITKRREAALRLQESEANLRTVLDNTEVSYVLTDQHLTIISFNHIASQSYKEAMGIQLREGQNLKNISKDGMKPETRRRFMAALDGQIVSYEASFAGSNVTTWYQVKILPVRGQSKEMLGLLVSSENITSRKAGEIERDKMTADLLRHNKNLEQFSYIVSHNLRAPVANIIGLAVLINNEGALSQEDYKKCITGLTEAARKLDNVIIDLDYILQVRREINEKKDIVSFPLLLEDIRTSISRLLEKENVHLHGHFEVESLFAIKSYLQSIFLNLIVNSIKYRNPVVNTNIHISSWKSNNKIFISFKDNGLGIDMEVHRDKIFGLYKKFHLHKEGKGMGLYMVKTQVEMLGGTISVNSRVNEGTEFVLEFEE